MFIALLLLFLLLHFIIYHWDLGNREFLIFSNFPPFFLVLSIEDALLVVLVVVLVVLALA